MPKTYLQVPAVERNGRPQEDYAKTLQSPAEEGSDRNQVEHTPTLCLLALMERKVCNYAEKKRRENQATECVQCGVLQMPKQDWPAPVIASADAPTVAC